MHEVGGSGCAGAGDPRQPAGPGGRGGTGTLWRLCEGPSHLDLQRALFLTPTSPQVHCGFLQITQAGGETAERFGSAGWAMAARVVPSAGELAGHGRVPEGARFP